MHKNKNSQAASLGTPQSKLVGKAGPKLRIVVMKLYLMR